MKKAFSLLLAAMAVLVFGSAKAQTIFFEDFNHDPSVSTLPAGWTAYGDTLDNNPMFALYNRSWQVWYPEDMNRDGEAMSVTYAVGSYHACDRWLITPRITLPADTVMSLLFRHRCSVFGQFSVMISTTGTDTSDFTSLIDNLILQHEKNYEHISLEEYAGQSVYIAFVNNVLSSNGGCAKFVALDDIEVTHLPENSIKLDNVDLPASAAVGEPVTVSLNLFNMGRNRINNITYSYRIDDGEPVVCTANIGSWYWRRSSVDITITPEKQGELTLEFTISMPNGVDDYDDSDNRIVKTLTVTDPPVVGIPAVEQGLKTVVYPNPTYGEVMVKSPESIVSAAVTDMAGRRKEVSPVASGTDNYKFDITTFPQGAYFLSLVTGDGQTHTVRLIKR